MAYRVALVDCNNFYVSCERVFDPKLEGRPVVVLSNNDGVIISRSNEAKLLGIGMAVPFFKVRPIIERYDVQTFSANFALYGDMSQRVMGTLSQFSPEMEIYSIDEAFLDLSGFKGVDLTAYARKIMVTVRQWTGIPVSIGVAVTKTLAKVANEIAKHSPRADGVRNIADSSHRDQALAEVDVEDVWGIGRRTAPPPKQGITISRSFGKPVESLEDLKEAVADYASRATEKLRSEGSVAKVVSVFLMTNPFNRDPQYHPSIAVELSIPTNSTPEILRPALLGLEKIYRQGFLYHKAGVMLTGLMPRGLVQGDLFQPETQERRRSKPLMEAVDRINARMGSGAVAFAAEGIHKGWRMKSERRSQRYTTRWDELVEVTAA